jgi:predicted NUDIX family NTP pyrophosphohydrolase
MSQSRAQRLPVKKRSAGILLYRRRGSDIEVFLVHPGGPSWMKKDDGALSIPKGEPDVDEALLAAAKREFYEETGSQVNDGPVLPLSPVKQAGGKVIAAWAIEGDLDPSSVQSQTFSMEWPPKSGQRREFPEVDRALWCTLTVARTKLLAGQHPFLDQLEQLLKASS